MNINTPPHMRHDMRFVSEEKKRAVANQNAKLREELPPRRYERLHTRYSDKSFPCAEHLREWAEEHWREHGEVPNAILYPYATTTRRVMFCVNRGEQKIASLPLWAPVTLEVIRSEHFRLVRNDA